MTLQPLQEIIIQSLDSLHDRSVRFILILGSAFIIVIGSLDYVTGFELSFSIFYLAPITILAWYVHPSAGVAASFASAIVWLIVDLYGGRAYSFAVIPFWNAAVRLAFFLTVTLTISALRRARAEQDELAHFIVHDLRSPLSSVLAGLHFLGDESGTPLDAEQQEMLIRLGISSCNRMLILINSLLDLGRLESGKMAMNIQEIPVQEIMKESTEQVMSLATRSDVNISTEIADGAETIRADSELTVRIIVNLLSNAIRYSPAEATVELCAEPGSDNTIVISIADSGQGIPREWINKLFLPYMQLQARQAGIGVGSGLGLSFCRLAVETQGGRIWVESEVGRGSKFIFTLPRWSENLAG